MESTESFIELINSLCRRPNMFVLNGSYKEVVDWLNMKQCASRRKRSNADER